jgi:hypothetical protein
VCRRVVPAARLRCPGRIPAPVPKTIADVLLRMRALNERLPSKDGVAHFNRMYLKVTEDVNEAAKGRDFEDPVFLERLDVVFANLYFRAVDAYDHDPASCPRAWVPLLQTRTNRRIAPIQFALAGMNAHINRDLVVAIVQACSELGREPGHATAMYRDFRHVNQLLADAQEAVEPWFKRGILGLVDRVLGRADEVAQIWSIERAREAAWVQAETLWKLRTEESLTRRFLDTLDRTVGFAGRGLLVPRPF